MQYKNPQKASLKQFRVNAYEEEEPRPKRMYSPKYTGYSTQNTQTNYSPRNQATPVQAGSPRHWKSYLAPQLSKLSPRIEQEEQLQTSPPQQVSGASRLKGYSSVYNLRSIDTNNASGTSQYRDQSAMEGYVGAYNQPGHLGRRQEYSRRKQQIMNRIRLLQERASIQDDREQGPSNASQLRYLNNSSNQELANRVAALQAKVESMNSEWQLKLKKELGQLEKRLRSELRPK